MSMTTTRGRRSLTISLLLLLLPAIFAVELVLSQVPVPDGFLESNHDWSGSQGGFDIGYVR